MPSIPSSTVTITTSASLPLSALLSPHPVGDTIKRRHSLASDSGETSPRPPKSPRTSLLEAAKSYEPSVQTSTQPQPADHTFTAPATPARNAPAQRMRSSIACCRCRRSKVKCVNSGVNTTCRSCEASGRECKYPVPSSGGRRREDSFTGSSARADETGDSEVCTQIRIRSIAADQRPATETAPKEKHSKRSVTRETTRPGLGRQIPTIRPVSLDTCCMAGIGTY